MIYLAANHSNVPRLALKGYSIGWMLSPRAGWRRPRADVPYAIDNGLYHAPDTEPSPVQASSNVYVSLNKIIGGPEPLFTVVPDIPYRGHASLELSRLHLPVLRDMFPDRRFAVAVQDGVTPTDDRVTLLAFDVIFVAGSTEWKWSWCREWAEFARDFGKGIHVARVNVNHRIEYCRDLGVDSVDGTGAGRGGDITWNRLTRCLAQNRLSETQAG